MDEIIPVYKPIGFSSYDIIRLYKKSYQFRDKIGHAGSLDPFACGVLLLLLGKATKKFSLIQQWQKTYLAGLRLGAISTTGDPEGEIKIKEITSLPKIKEIKSISQQFIGEIVQRVPSKSAAKYRGRPLYKIKKEIFKTKRVRIYNIEVVAYKFPLLSLRITCSSGTYIRQLAQDIGEKLKTGAFLYYLEREQIGPYRKENCLSLSELLQKTASEDKNNKNNKNNKKNKKN